VIIETVPTLLVLAEAVPPAQPVRSRAEASKTNDSVLKILLLYIVCSLSIEILLNYTRILGFDPVRKPRKACEKAENLHRGGHIHSFFTAKVHIVGVVIR
jgi:hypothetical protein